MIRGKREDTEGVREAEFIVLDFIKSTPNATVPEIARLIDDVGADVDYVANVLGVDPVVARQAYNEVINGAPPIEQVIEKQAASDPIVPPITPLKDVIDTSGAAGAVASGNPLVSDTETSATTTRNQETISTTESRDDQRSSDVPPSGAGGIPEPSKIGNLLGRIFSNENSVAPGLQRVNLTDNELQSAISQILNRTKYSDVDTISRSMRRLGNFVDSPSSTVQNFISAATGIPVSAGLFQPEGYDEYISQARIARNRGQEFAGLGIASSPVAGLQGGAPFPVPALRGGSGLAGITAGDGTFGQTVGAGGVVGQAGGAGGGVATVPDAVDPNLRRNIQTGGMAGPQLPVGLAAAEQAALGGAGRATGLLGTTAGAAGRELTAGTLGGIGALRGGIGQARQDIMQGTQTGIGALQQALGGARADIESGFQRAEGMFDPYAQAGGQALQQQLALSGALGPEAFQQAYQESPQMQFLREQGERAALRTAAARGGLGGGRVMQELARYGTGLASQDLQNQIANLQALSAQGLGARGSAANIATGGAQQLANLGVLGGTAGLQAATQQGTQLANLAQQLGVRESDLLTGLGAGRSNIALGIGTRAADLAAQTGLNVAGMRTRAGEQLAGQFGTAASQLADLQQAQGAGTASMIGAQTNYMNQLQQAAAAGDAQAQTQLAQLQANINMGIGSNLAGVPAAQFTPLPNPAGSIFQGAALGYQFGQGMTPSTARPTTYPIADMTQMTGTAPAGYQAYNPFGVSLQNLGS